jgi:hypothetical protein
MPPPPGGAPPPPGGAPPQDASQKQLSSQY